ncbi:uncharacterized protein LOC121373703 [Gigantopelta aegis]|uniref:uncharacterized protein LOC121373703 n=1 Tax=Gigantopelta aegis TaxID=1735272 RepID=UPI001B88D406|nr:uncharacterized protein LOC121373703 [Gigantopelta aegis]
MVWVMLLLLGGNTVMHVLGVYPCDSMPKGLPNPPSLPSLPEQYEVTFEVNVVEKMKSFLVRESFDHSNKMAALHVTSENLTVTNIIDFNTGERYRFAPNGTCMTYNIHDWNPDNMFLLGDIGTVHSGDVFNFWRNYHEIYVEKTEIRGIPVNHWASCRQSYARHATFRVDYFFSRDNFLSPTNDTNIPIRMIVTGELALHKDSQGNAKPTGNRNFSYVYEYSYFKPGPIKDQTVFHSPKGIVCKGRMNVKQLPRIPHQFTVDMEIKNPIQSRAFRTYFDYSFKLTRSDMFYPPKSGSKYGVISVIQDFESEVVYRINQRDGKCVMQSLQALPDWHMKYIFDLLNVSNKTYVYQGKRMLRDMVVDAWGNVTDDGIVQELYFVPPSNDSIFGNRGNAGSNTSPSVIPEHLSSLVGLFRRNINHKVNTSAQTLEQEHLGKPYFKGETTLHIYNFMLGHPDLSVFDISPCYPDGSREMYLQFVVPGRYSEDVTGQSSEFYTAVRSIIAKVAGISLLRVGSLHIRPSDSEEDKLLIVVTLLDKTPSTVKVKKGFYEFTLPQAYYNLVKALNHHRLNFSIGTAPEIKWYTIEKDSLAKTTNPLTGRNSENYSAASMAGLGIGMILLGCILGLFIAFVIYRRANPFSLIPYQRTST